MVAHIARIIHIVDTREWVEGPDDRWIAVAGSGDARQCDRCDRTHEVHVYVELADGSQAVIGTGCAKGDAMERAVKSSIVSAKRAKRLAAELEAARTRLADALRIEAEVDTLVPPEPVEREPGKWYMDTVCVWTHLSDGEFTAERHSSLEHMWRNDERQARGLTRPSYLQREYVAWLEKRLHAIKYPY